MANELSNRFNRWMKPDDFFNDLGRSFFGSDVSFSRDLKTDVKETDKNYTVKVDVPGVNKKDITLEYTDGTLLISAKRDSFKDESDKEGNIITSERSYGRFSRQYNLPSVDKENIKAKYTDGVLEVDLPKLKDSSASKNHIEIE
ncbi:Hsp20/alpha crystallin family protein [Liquorilactobacillus oeni]|uniref:Heat shock protein Hsp20 n=1 Tax=Liquorilactobacillus oeni DSM 19972 TaxID=1423777 RepID=A0A0R1MN72_9LACO|nr:Hsp20/alpha crystallin family protein [Liquorilactobacillus oeni]KRL05947.1 heat shock protein Hsp20 [Liquorilactobacillus oeni DSM 19972]